MRSRRQGRLRAWRGRGRSRSRGGGLSSSGDCWRRRRRRRQKAVPNAAHRTSCVSLVRWAPRHANLCWRATAGTVAAAAAVAAAGVAEAATDSDAARSFSPVPPERGQCLGCRPPPPMSTDDSPLKLSCLISSRSLSDKAGAAALSTSAVAMHAPQVGHVHLCAKGNKVSHWAAGGRSRRSRTGGTCRPTRGAPPRNSPGRRWRPCRGLA